MIVMHRDRLFYNQFRYCLQALLNGVVVLRDLKSQGMIKSRIRQLQGNSRFILDRSTADNLCNMYDYLTSAQESQEFRFVVSYSMFWMYSNDLSWLQTVAQLSGVINPDYREAVVDRPFNSVLLKKSDYNRRTFLKNVVLSDNQREFLKNFFNNYHDSIQLSPSLQNWVQNGHGRVFDYYFIDHNDDNLMTLLSLGQSNLVRKTVDILIDK